MDHAVSITDDEILEESLYWLRWHTVSKWGDRNPWDAFNRLLAKSIKVPGWQDGDRMNIQLHQVRSYRDKRSTHELSHFRKGHDRNNPKNVECPLIVAVYEGAEWLLDGNTRINHWIEQGDTDKHNVNVHIIDTESSAPKSESP